MNVCGACGLDFTSLGAFDAHRVGRHAYTFKQGLAMEPPREDGRRCLGPGDPDSGYAPGRDGRWTLVKDQLRWRERLQRDPERRGGVI